MDIATWDMREIDDEPVFGEFGSNSKAIFQTKISSSSSLSSLSNQNQNQNQITTQLQNNRRRPCPSPTFTRPSFSQSTSTATSTNSPLSSPLLLPLSKKLKSTTSTSTSTTMKSNAISPSASLSLAMDGLSTNSRVFELPLNPTTSTTTPPTATTTTTSMTVQNNSPTLMDLLNDFVPMGQDASNVNVNVMEQFMPERRLSARRVEKHLPTRKHDRNGLLVLSSDGDDVCRSMSCDNDRNVFLTNVRVGLTNESGKIVSSMDYDDSCYDDHDDSKYEDPIATHGELLSQDELLLQAALINVADEANTISSNEIGHQSLNSLIGGFLDECQSSKSDTSSESDVDIDIDVKPVVPKVERAVTPEHDVSTATATATATRRASRRPTTRSSTNSRPKPSIKNEPYTPPTTKHKSTKQSTKSESSTSSASYSVGDSSSSCTDNKQPMKQPVQRRKRRPKTLTGIDAELANIFSEDNYRLDPTGWAQLLKTVALTPAQHDRAKKLRRKALSCVYANRCRLKQTDAQLQTSEAKEHLAVENDRLRDQNRGLQDEVERLKDLLTEFTATFNCKSNNKLNKRILSSIS